MSLKDAGVKVIPYSLLEKLNQEGTVNIESREELDLFLRFQHDIGNILYFGTKELKEQIMLDPQWLIHALRTLITAEDFILKRVKKPTVIRKWREFSKTGKLTQELIDAIWTKEEHKEILDNKDHILPLMEKLNIITRPRSYSEDQMEVKVENYFLAPCMLRQTTPKEIISPDPHPEIENSPVLCCVFIEKFLPSPIFHRLIASCLSHWPIAEKKSENLIFCGCCVFDVDPCQKLTLYLRGHVIFARVSKMSLEKKTPDSKVCIYVKKCIDENLLNIIGCLSQKLMFEWYIQCPKTERDLLDGIFSMSQLQASKQLFCTFHDKGHIVVPQDLLKFWVEDKKTQGEDEGDIAFLFTDILDRIPTECDLGRLSMKIGKEFFVLGLHLGLSSANIEQIRLDHLHTVTQCLMILVKWKLESGDKATFRNLEMAFRSAYIDIDILTTITASGECASCLPPRMLDMQVDESHLNQLCNGIGKEYVHLGVELGVPVSRIEQIRIGWPNDVSRQCFEIMNEWKQTKAMQATFRNLELAVRHVGIDPSILRQCFS
ncbi:hypothetical protein CHS0354_036358 [Potamilus streckersoni]|uniref:Death domain-containing protein n=1 Tax=Potamilus streckersoni TaxID=2493646 RepID=A0AAE0SS35_9BIVA|nr:hypothetical protein CHS0354_036358 [Potamilus streckersoni]